MQVEFAAGLGEVVERGGVSGDGLWVLCVQCISFGNRRWQSDVDPAVPQFSGMEDSVGCGLALDQRPGRCRRIRRYRAIFGSYLTAPWERGTQKKYILRNQCRYHNLQVTDNASSGGEGGIRTPDTR